MATIQRRVNIHFFILLYGWSGMVEERLQKIVLISEENTRFLPEPLFHQFFQHSLIQDQNVKIEDNPHLMLLQYVFPNHCENIVSDSTNKSTLKKCSKGKNYAFGDDLPSGCQGARTTLHGSSSAPAPSSFFISDDIFKYFRCVSNSAVKHAWSLWAWFQTECLLDHLDVQLKFAGALFIFPDFDWGSPTHINTAINRVFTW